MRGRPSAVAARVRTVASLAGVAHLTRTHGKLSGRGGWSAHLVGGDPARTIHFCLDSLAADFLDNVRDAYPEQTNGHWVLAGFIVNGELDLVGLVDVDVVVFGIPAIISGCFGASDDRVFDLDGNKRFGTSRKTTRDGMIHVLDRHDTNR